MQPRKIILKCINCGKDFEQEVKATDPVEYEKEVAWYRKHQKHCPACRMARMGHGYGR